MTPYPPEFDYERARGTVIEVFRQDAEKAGAAGVTVAWEFEPGRLFNKPGENPGDPGGGGSRELHDPVRHGPRAAVRGGGRASVRGAGDPPGGPAGADREACRQDRGCPPDRHGQHDAQRHELEQGPLRHGGSRFSRARGGAPLRRVYPGVVDRGPGTPDGGCVGDRSRCLRFRVGARVCGRGVPYSWNRALRKRTPFPASS